MSKIISAALLLYRIGERNSFEVFIAHMGGPFWARKDNGGWSIPKGELDDKTEDLLELARREFHEEIGVQPPDGDLLHLGDFKQPSGKLIVAYVAETSEPLEFRSSNTFEMEWPKGSGAIKEFPEIDRAAWYSSETAKQKLVKGQVPILEALEEELVKTGRIQPGSQVASEGEALF